MKIAVSGGAGYIGSHTCKLLANLGHEIFVYDNLSTGHNDYVKWGKLHYGDIRDYRNIRSFFRTYTPEVIIHFAANAYVGESIVNPSKYFRNNISGTLSLLDAMVDENINNIVVSSSCAVYGQPKNIPITEEEDTKPINPYGASKLFMERMLEDFRIAHGINWVSLRYFNAAGASPDKEIGELHFPEPHLIPRIMFAALGLIEKIDIFGTDYPTRDGTCIRDYIHVDDLANAHFLAAKYLLNGGRSQSFNLGTGKGLTVKEIIDIVQNLSCTEINKRFKPRRKGDPGCLIADSSKAKSILGWIAKNSFEKTLEDAWNFALDKHAFFKKYISLID